MTDSIKKQNLSSALDRHQSIGKPEKSGNRISGEGTELVTESTGPFCLWRMGYWKWIAVWQGICSAHANNHLINTMLQPSELTSSVCIAYWDHMGKNGINQGEQMKKEMDGVVEPSILLSQTSTKIGKLKVWIIDNWINVMLHAILLLTTAGRYLALSRFCVNVQ